MMNHKQALIVFWCLVIITVISWSLTIYLIETDTMTQNIARVLTITDLLFIPLIIMILMIPSGFFDKKQVS